MSRRFGLVFGLCLLLIGGSIPLAAAVDEGLVLYYTFDEVTNDQITDRSGNENHGSVFGDFEVVEGKIDNGIHMIGSKANYVEVADGESLDLTEVYSLLVWANFSEITGDRHQFFFDKGADDKTPGGWRVGKVMSGSLILQVFKDGAWKPQLVFQTPDFDTDQWYHVAVTRDEQGRARLYLDGEEKASSESEDYVFPLNDNALILWGSTVFGPNNMFVGTLDEFAVFKDRALTAPQIRSFMTGRGAGVSQKDKLATLWGWLKR